MVTGKPACAICQIRFIRAMSITQDIRNAFNRRDNALIQLILLNVLVFATLIVLRAIMTVSSTSAYYPPVMKQFALSSDLGVLLRHPWTLLSYAFTHEGFFHILERGRERY